METRFNKRGGKAKENNEANPKLLQAVEDLAQEFEEVPIQSKKRKPIKYSPKKTSKSSLIMFFFWFFLYYFHQ